MIYPKGIKTSNNYSATNKFFDCIFVDYRNCFFTVYNIYILIVNNTWYTNTKFFLEINSKYFMYNFEVHGKFFLCLFSINLLIVFEKLQCAISRP